MYASVHASGISAWLSEALNVLMSFLMIVYQPLALKIVAGPFALKGSRFFIGFFTPSISIMISGISGEGGNVNLGILKSSSVNILQKWLIKTQASSELLVTMVPFSCMQ